VVPGSTAVLELETPVPGDIKLVDHALSRVARKGMLGVIAVEGAEQPGIFRTGA
jgi:nitrite reductase (NO-forming)